MIRAPRATLRRTASSLLAGASLVGATASARAEPARSASGGASLGTSGDAQTAASKDARAEQLFRSGEKKFDTGDYAGACDDFSESLKLGSKLGTLLNLALCHETIGKPVTAWTEFSHAAAWAAQNNQRDRYEFALQHIRALETKLPRVLLQLPQDEPVGALDLDGEPLPEQQWYLPLFLDPGEHRLGVSAPGKERTAVAFRVTASPNEQIVYIPRLAEAPPPPRAPAPRHTRDPSRKSIGIAGLTFGAAAIAAGATFGVLAITGDERDPEVKQRATIATIGFVSGIALAATGGFLLWTSPRGQAFAAAPRPGGAAFAWSATF